MRTRFLLFTFVLCLSTTFTAGYVRFNRFAGVVSPRFSCIRLSSKLIPSAPNPSDRSLPLPNTPLSTEDRELFRVTRMSPSSGRRLAVKDLHVGDQLRGRVISFTK
jgi:hypothetical protein